MKKSKYIKRIVAEAIDEEIASITGKGNEINPIEGLKGLTKVGVQKKSPFEGIVSIE